MLTNAFQVSAEAREVLFPGGMGNSIHGVRRAGAGRPFGPHWAKGTLHAASGLEEANRLAPPVMQVSDAYVSMNFVWKPVDSWLLTVQTPSWRRRRRGDAHELVAALKELPRRPRIVEKLDHKKRRVFELPGGATPITLRELTFETAGFGHRVWDAGVALSLWLSQHAETVRGKHVLELGSGVGISGIAAAACGASYVTLSDYCGDMGPNLLRRAFAFEDLMAARRAELLCDNLEGNARLSRVADRCEAITLDWHASLRSGFAPARRYEAIVGSDIVYNEDDVDALVATIVAHLQPGATCHLMLPKGRTGLPRLLSTLSELGDVTTEELAVVNSFQRTELCRVEFVCPPRTGMAGSTSMSLPQPSGR